MMVKATFIGTDSLGYINGKVYLLDIHGLTIQRSSIMTMYCQEKAMHNQTNRGLCKYDSIQSFLSNWTDIRNISGMDNKTDQIKEIIDSFDM